jgi:hypothetical protein
MMKLPDFPAENLHPFDERDSIAAHSEPSAERVPSVVQLPSRSLPSPSSPLIAPQDELSLLEAQIESLQKRRTELIEKQKANGK